MSGNCRADYARAIYHVAVSWLRRSAVGKASVLYDAVLSAAGERTCLDIVYLVSGKFTRRLSGCMPGQALEVWGPLGNGFPPQAVDHLIMVAGGIGQTPFLALATEQLGVRSYGPQKLRCPSAEENHAVLWGAECGLPGRRRRFSKTGNRRAPEHGRRFGRPAWIRYRLAATSAG